MSDISCMGENKIMRKYNGVFKPLCVFFSYVIELRLFQEVTPQMISTDYRYTFWNKCRNLYIRAERSHSHFFRNIKNCSRWPVRLTKQALI